MLRRCIEQRFQRSNAFLERCARTAFVLEILSQTLEVRPGAMAGPEDPAPFSGKLLSSRGISS
jgi:hypothetical protein